MRAEEARGKIDGGDVETWQVPGTVETKVKSLHFSLSVRSADALTEGLNLKYQQEYTRTHTA